MKDCSKDIDRSLLKQKKAFQPDDPDRIALLSGRPVLIVPAGYYAAASHTHAALVWDGGRASSRALSSSLGLLEDQGRVTVLTVGDEPTPRPVTEVMEHLARHDVSASHEAIAAIPGVARALLAWCRKSDPCRLVMGAYEHSKFREDFLSGVTARVMRDTPIPILLSHLGNKCHDPTRSKNTNYHSNEHP